MFLSAALAPGICRLVYVNVVIYWDNRESEGWEWQLSFELFASPCIASKLLFQNIICNIELYTAVVLQGLSDLQYKFFHLLNLSIVRSCAKLSR